MKLASNQTETAVLSIESAVLPIDTPQLTEPVQGGLGLPAGNLVLNVCRNATAHLAGRNLISLGRLVVASTIARTYGKEIFGEYSLIIVLLTLAEWLLDFGTSDVFTREICKKPEQGQHFLRILSALKLLQIVFASASFLLFILLMNYPSQIVKAGLFGSVSLLFFGGVLIFHVLFKATLTIEREVVAELVSVLVMIALIRTVSRYGGSLVLLFGCYAVSRATFFTCCDWFGRARFRLSIKGVSWPDVRWAFHSSAAMGAIGFIVVIYEAADVLLLSRLGSLSDVAYYSGAQRFISPVVVALTAIGATLYPVAASYWPESRVDFERSCQRALDTVFVVAGLAICVILAGADSLMRLLGPDLGPGSQVLSVLALVLFVKAITNTLGSVLYVVEAQNRALSLVVGALITKTTLITLLAPRFGYVGVALSALITDSATATLTLWLLRKHSGFRVRWSIPLKMVLVTLIASLAAIHFVPAHSLVTLVAAVALFIPLTALVGAVRVSDVMSLMNWKAS